MTLTDGDHPLGVTGPSSLIDLHSDIWIHVATFLPTPALAALMQTSSHLVELAASALCTRTKDTPLRRALDVVSFYHFLRIGDSISRRAARVKVLRFEIGDAADLYQLPDISPGEVINAFTEILHHCRDLRRLQMIQWYYQVPPSHIYRSISHSGLLEELELNVVEEVEEEDVLQLANLPLRTLLCSSTARVSSKPRDYAVLGTGPLARTLVEVQLPLPAHACTLLGATFNSVRKLRISVPRHSTFVNDLRITFPNISHLTLLGQCPWHDPRRPWASRHAEDGNDVIRQAHQQQWKDDPNMLPALKYVRVEDPRAAYILGLNKPISWISIKWLSYTPSHIFPDVIAHTHPTSLEFVLDNPNYRGSLLIDNGPFGGLQELADRPGAVSSLRCLTIHFRCFMIPSVERDLDEALDMLESVLRHLPISHLMLKLDTGPVYPDFLDYIKETYDPQEGVEILDAAEGWAELMAEASSGSECTFRRTAFAVGSSLVRSLAERESSR
ncbi:hypothetical protein DICSQDRAFT_177628 [Dichomitus squalens LYAD-421 SS1]|uniref:uncharacterized protein n=1 Tax=Dichomitus squalens (strain LYAD-421) TaxID=732165 RepID=UPI0004410F5C|nr:uncharacterized protein DICSQDRAFT_177628 [Dichomitus squalens LYAD-421 SS1]EJF66280.1 hypothetical protein DICSQDRAFT_177628 [Dichomitus squalens LYAD-421 SS1]